MDKKRKRNIKRKIINISLAFRNFLKSFRKVDLVNICEYDSNSYTKIIRNDLLAKAFLFNENKRVKNKE